MNRFTLVLRNLLYFRGVNLAVIAGMAVSTAVLTGALMVGDSVRGSLADLAHRRLGPVDYALFSTRFFPQTLADRLAADKRAGDVARIIPAIIVQGGAVNDSDAGKPRTADVQIGALGDPPPKVAPLDIVDLPVARGACVVNQLLATALSIQKPGPTLLLSVPTQGDAPRESPLARRGRNDVLNQVRADVAKVAAFQNFAALFSPNGSQRTPRNAWVNLQDLQETIDQPGRANVLLAHAKSANARPDEDVAALNEQLGKIVTLEDYGIAVRAAGNHENSAFARDTYLAPPMVAAAEKAADSLKLRLREVSVNLVNSIGNITSGQPPRAIHYAVGAGISSLDEGQLAPNEIAINQWSADQLNAKVGDTLRIDYYLRQSGGDLTDASKILKPAQLTFVVRYVLPMAGMGADPDLPPNYKGLTDADSVADWDPPEGLKIDKKLVTAADEDYWKKYHAAPKLYINFETARKLWGGVYGDVTGLRIPAASSAAFSRQLLANLHPESMGLSFRPIKAQQLEAASGGTDFSMFFVMFSFFLIVAAALLVAMLFRLNVEQRARQIGLMSAIGFSPGRLRRMALGEGMLLALLGGVIGLAGAIGYTYLIILGLRTRWMDAVGTTSMRLHIVPLTLAYGFAASLLVACCAILWAVWRVGKAQAARLLAGGWGLNIGRRGRGRIIRWIGISLALIGIATVAMSVAGSISAEEGFGGGALLLCGALFWLGATLRPRPHAGASFVGAASLARLGIRNGSRHTARGVLSVGLIGFAAFTLITVAAMQQQGIKDPGRRDSPTGGYRLILSAAIPLTGDLNTVEGRQLLGIREPRNPLWRNVHFTALRRWAGQDISCLNLTKPSSPTILGVPPEMIERNAFIKGDAITTAKNPWQLLDSDQGEEIPVIADADTQEYVLQVPLKGTIPITDQLGRPRKLVLVATIAHSIFQGQLLMSDANFRKLFPAQSGFGVVLIDVPGSNERRIEHRVDLAARALSTELADYSVSVDTTVSRFQAYQNVQNTYMETFQTLGALGLMLGTLGLAVVLIRTVIERKAELALLASLGFTSAARVGLVLSENAFLLILGLALGTACAVIGIIPALTRESRPINIANLAGTLGIVLAVGLISSAIAVSLSGIRVKPADLRRE
ncbi:MAG TPA: ABC transporter permease [Tepidisphaeraceae bacterium]|nr:ABC transporter permease [Tepidisphaeraceae bacterium]